MCVHYLKAAGWQLDWIETAVELGETCWRTHYKPAHFNEAAPATELSATAPSFAFSSYMDHVLSKLNHEETVLVLPIDAFVNAKPVFNIIGGKCAMFNPLTWWYGQRAVGNGENGLTQMALGVLSTPASSVDIERAFFVRRLDREQAPTQLVAEHNPSHGLPWLVRQGQQGKAGHACAAIAWEAEGKPPGYLDTR
ncbi:hypothetical protein BDV93DRAFT_513919 [Ceratobasidium sp. AG-I]|nr:hypothetical protein BDV93DRAFT_513919 [Ceratobasidium sp. AG-I]